MDIKLLTKEQDTIRFVLSDVSPAFANALRRIILAEASDPVEVVYTSNLKPENPEVKPVSDKVPIVKLAQGQRIKLEAYARLGRGRDHAKWQPASACTYSYDPKAKTFNFLVESTGTLPPEKLVLDAA